MIRSRGGAREGSTLDAARDRKPVAARGCASEPSGSSGSRVNSTPPLSSWRKRSLQRRGA